MFGPGEYRPDPSEGITSIADLPPPEIVRYHRNDTRQPLQLDQVVQEALTLLRASLPSTVDIQYHVSEPGVMVQANRTQLLEVIMNLGANADYAMRQSGSRLTVRVDLVEVDAAFAMAYPPLSPGRHVCRGWTIRAVVCPLRS